jgi:hypothetical protein
LDFGITCQRLILAITFLFLPLNKY